MCKTLSPRAGIEGDWQTDWNRYFITAETITTYMRKDAVSDFIPQDRYSYTKSGNETKGTVTVTLQSIWNNDDNKWYTVNEYIEVMMKQMQETLDRALLGDIVYIGEDKNPDWDGLISELEGMATEVNMTFDKNNLTEANLDKPIPEDIKKLYIAYYNKMSVTQKEEMTKPRTYEYKVTDDPWNGTMIHFSSVYDTTKKWFEQTAGSFSTYDGTVVYYPQYNNLSTQNGDDQTNIFFSSVTETSLTERGSGKTWTASWNGNTLTLKSEDISYELTWSGEPLY